MREPRVRILNPVPGSNESTSLNRARRFVKRGLARFVDGSESTIQFLNTPAQAAVVQNAEERLHAHVTGINYDLVRNDFFACARNLPLLFPERMTAARRTRK